MTQVTLLRSRSVPGWPAGPNPRRPGEYHTPGPAYSVNLSTALTREFTSDAHATAYATPNGHRLRSSAAGRIPIHITTLWLDVDCPEAHAVDGVASRSWRRGALEAVRRTVTHHPSPCVYHTRGGIRVVYAIDPYPIESAEAAADWRRIYLATVCHLESRYGLAADVACADWTRLYRLPNVVRDGKRERSRVYGDPQNVGVFRADITDEDIARARERVPTAWETVRRLEFGPAKCGDGRGLLFYLLQGDGAIIRERDAESYYIRCPNEAQHTKGSTGDGSTLLYLPRGDGEVGAIHCKHSHCVGLRQRDWVALWSHQERDRARDLGGIVSRCYNGRR